VAIEYGDGAGGEERVHGGRLLGVCANGDEPLPVSKFGGGTGAVIVEAGGGDLKGLYDGRGRDAGVVHGSRWRDDGDGLDGIAHLDGRRWLDCRGEVEGQDLIDGEVLGGEDAIEAFEGECALAVEEV